jgi:hypothetical protein
MATLIPDLERAKAMKQKPTAGELYLLEHLEKSLNPTSEVYFQPCFNGDRPDVVILEKGLGLIIIEVKDWNLNLYSIDKKNDWHLKEGGKGPKSPFRQVYRYKKNFFEIHVNGMLEKSLKDPRFFGLIKTYVYFHEGTKHQLDKLYDEHLEGVRTELRENEFAFTSQAISHEVYEKKRLYLEQKRFQFDRDKSTVALTKGGFKSEVQHPGFQ